jgi:hypothetical protein
METLEDIKGQFTNSCQCYDCTNEDCMTLNVSADYEPECDSCGAKTKPANYCDGVCFEDEVQYWDDEVFPQYLNKVGNPKWLKVSGHNVGWRRRAGYDIVRGDFQALFTYLQIERGDWRLDFTLSGKNLKVMRYSHDEPTGASYEVEALRTISDSMSIDEAVVQNLVDEYGCHKACGEYFYDCNCEAQNEY